MATVEQAKDVLRMAKAIQQDVNEILQKKECPLTARERQILSLVALGLEYRQIAHELKVSVQTIKNHLSRVRACLNAPNSVRAVIVALEHGWIDFPKEER